MYQSVPQTLRGRELPGEIVWDQAGSPGRQEARVVVGRRRRAGGAQQVKIGVDGRLGPRAAASSGRSTFRVLLALAVP